MSLASEIANARTRIVTLLQGVSGIGQVHAYMRWVEDDASKASLFVSGGRLHVWMLSLGGQPAQLQRFPANHTQGRLLFHVHGFYALDDSAATQTTFENLVAAVIDAFGADKKLSNSVIESGPAQWQADDEGGHRVFAGVLCHYARLALPVRVAVEC